ncbi:hypothetical protein [Bacteroides sp.]|uniref:hypothetical protein n=1 Tax=Bacteroides sp. TaxID=29523 RepID=UPI0026357603|nr:hypothetical protein [Bacteroides sp.]MDD3039893.1 hypothetical protein [Bacteroides sp.]
MKKYSFKIQSLLVTLLLCTLTACSADDELADNGGNATLNGTPIEVGAFPAFTENVATRAVGTFDAGKTAWANSDEILLKVEVYPGFDDVTKACTGKAVSTECYKLTYNGTSWTADKAISLTTSTYEAGIKTTAYYAPCYEWNTASKELALKTDKAAGTDEYLTAENQMPYTSLTKEGKLSIAFPATRTYSRLRVAATATNKVTLTSEAFTANDGITTAATAISATADDKGNAYFYGSWTKGANFTFAIVQDGSTYKIEKTVTDASVNGQSYAANAVVTKVPAEGGTYSSGYILMSGTYTGTVSITGDVSVFLKDASRTVSDGVTNAIAVTQGSPVITVIGTNNNFKGNGAGILVGPDASVTIKGSTENAADSKLTIHAGTSTQPGIGCDSEKEKGCKDITIENVTLDVTGGYGDSGGGAAIGMGHDGAHANINDILIKNSIIIATSGPMAATIGFGFSAANCSINSIKIVNSPITAYVEDYMGFKMCGAGIGFSYRTNGTQTIKSPIVIESTKTDPAVYFSDFKAKNSNGSLTGTEIRKVGKTKNTDPQYLPLEVWQGATFNGEPLGTTDLGY